MPTKEHESVELIREYRKYLRKLFGKNLEEASWVEYYAGWYNVKWGQSFGDGSYGRIGWEHHSYRKNDFIKEIEELKERIKERK